MRLSLVAEQRQGYWHFSVLFFRSEDAVCYAKIRGLRLEGLFRVPKDVPVGELELGIQEFVLECKKHLERTLFRKLGKQKEVLEDLSSPALKKRQEKKVGKTSRKLATLFFQRKEKFEMEDGALVWKPQEFIF